MARTAAAAGADGVLLLPPYLVTGPPAGLVTYVEAVARETHLPVIVYNREQARFDPEAAAAVAQLPTVMGFKDGVGDVDLLTRILVAVRECLAGTGKTLQFFNGLPTAETSVLAYRALGLSLYSSAVFAFAPEISLAFHAAVERGEDEFIHALLHEFFAPFVRLRNKLAGGAISLVKAAVRLRGLDVGGVRAPLLDPNAQQLAELDSILANGVRIVQRHHTAARQV
jgi:5-dehydro-4-deoxyglucarate dehydratase